MIGFAVSALAVYFLLQQVPPEQLGEALQKTQPLPLVLLVASVMGSVLTRAARWQVYFRPERRVPFGPLFGTLSISYMASTFLPLRAGELVRAVFLSQREALPIARIVGTILLEKLFDFLAIGVMLVLLVLLVPTLPAEARVAGISIASVILVGFGFVVALAVFRQSTLALIKVIEGRVPFGLGVRFRLEHGARQFAAGTDSLRLPGLWVAMVGWTVITWLFALATGWAGAAALGLNPGLAALVFALVVASTGQAVPSSPGYVGVYHFAVTEAFKSFGMDAASALAVAVLTHAFTYGSLVVVGLIALWTGGYSFSSLVGAGGWQPPTP
jgi:glycosyltransferase 2 family protein